MIEHFLDLARVKIYIFLNFFSESPEDPDFSPSKFDLSYSESEGKRRRKKVRNALFRFETEGERDLSKKFQCPHCIKGYSNKRDFELHVLRHESDLGKGWKCQRCPDVAFEIRLKKFNLKITSTFQLKIAFMYIETEESFRPYIITRNKRF